LALPGADRGAGNLADDRRQNYVPLELYAAVLERLAGDHEGCNAPLHIRDAGPLSLAADDAALELRLRFDVSHHPQIGAGAGVARIGVAVESQAQSGAVAFKNADRIRPVELDILAHRLEAVRLEPGEDEIRDGLLLPGRARNAGEVAAELRQLVA